MVREHPPRLITGYLPGNIFTLNGLTLGNSLDNSWGIPLEWGITMESLMNSPGMGNNKVIIGDFMGNSLGMVNDRGIPGKLPTNKGIIGDLPGNYLVMGNDRVVPGKSSVNYPLVPH